MSLLNFLIPNKQAAGAEMGIAPTSSDLPLGEVIAGRYTLVEPIGEGAMGKVFRAEDKMLGVSIALKVLSQNLVSEQLVKQFSREAQIGAFLGNQNIHIVRVLDYGLHNEVVPFYAMEYVYGSTLEEEIMLQPMPVPRCIRLMQQVCAGLESAHQGVLIEDKLCCVVHRDIKPSNIFITHNSSLGELAKILDFGIADFFQYTNRSDEQQAMGTLAYSSAEQLQGKQLDPRADIYSLGVTMFEVLTGQLPIAPARDTVPEWIAAHSHQPPKRVADVAPHLKIPDALEALIQSCLAKDVSRRPQTIQDVHDELKKIGASVSAGTASYSNAQSTQDILDELFDEAEETVSYNKASSSNETLVLGQQPSATETLVLGNQPSAPAAQVQIPDGTLALQAWNASWPSNKPNAEIVFADSFSVGGPSGIASLWVMLSHAEVQYNHLPQHCIEFMFELDPYPMMGWVTVLFNQKGTMRSLPCYLDLTDPKRVQMLQQLAKQGEYLFILFDINNPGQPVQVTTLEINSTQRQILASMLNQAKLKTQLGAKHVSKLKLKEQYQRLKKDLTNRLKPMAVR